MQFLHTVYFWLKSPDDPKQCEVFETALKKFMKDSTYAKDAFIGRPAGTPREVVDGTFTYSLNLIFDNAEKHQRYQQEKAHKSFLDAASKLWERVKVYDSISIY